MNLDDIKIAAEHLKKGELVAFPTETVYGLGADATNDRAVAEIFAVKGRPQFNPLIVHVADVEMAKRYVQWNALADVLSQAFWPGPLTLVLPRKTDCTVSLLVSAGLDSIAIRMPAHPLAQALLKESGLPLAAPSANRSGRVSPTLAEHVREELGDSIAMILDGGRCEVGIESTVVDVTAATPTILRPGSITREMLEQKIGRVEVVTGSVDGAAASPGMLASHYAPNLPVRLNVTEVRPGEALLAFGPYSLSGAVETINLSKNSDLKSAASSLFLSIRKLDNPLYSGIAVMPIPETGIGIAINDRLRRAATR